MRRRREHHPEVGLKYGQAIALGSDAYNSPSLDQADYDADRARDLFLAKTCGLEPLYTGVACYDQGVVSAPVPAWATHPHDAVLFPANFGANPFSGPAFSEPKLIGFAYAYEQATQHRVPPASTTP